MENTIRGWAQKVQSWIIPHFEKGNRKNGLSNKHLIDRLTSDFRRGLEQESVEGYFMIYPMVFTILLDKKDYTDREQAFKPIVDVCEKNFYDIINGQTKYPMYPPMSRYWQFKFVPCEALPLDIPDCEFGIGNPVILWQLYSSDSVNNASGDVPTATQTAAIHCTYNPRKSRITAVAHMNKEILGNIEMPARGVFKKDFDFSQIPTISYAGVYNGGYAKLSSEGNHPYYMKDHKIEISGHQDPRTFSNIWKLNRRLEPCPYAIIKYDALEKAFKIAAFGTLNVDGNKIAQSEGEPKYVTIPRQCSLLINTAGLPISVKFAAK